jgi:hypothetical protein
LQLKDSELGALAEAKPAFALVGLDVPPQVPGTLMGKHEAWAAVRAREQLPAELAEGPEMPRPAFRLAFTQGKACAGDRPRQAAVYFRCGAEDALLRVVEPDACRYLLLASSPAACGWERAAGQGGSAPEEEEPAAWWGASWLHALPRFGLLWPWA